MTLEVEFAEVQLSAATREIDRHVGTASEQAALRQYLLRERERTAAVVDAFGQILKGTR